MEVSLLVIILALQVCSSLSTSQVAGNLSPGKGDKLSTMEIEMERMKSEMDMMNARMVLVESRLNGRCLGDTPQTAVYSCEDIQLRRVCSDQSGYYWLLGGYGEPVKVYCEMSGEECCGGRGVFMRVANIDMTRPDYECPVDWQEITSPRRACARPENAKGYSLKRIHTHHIPYHKVCGRVVGYQYGPADGFAKGSNLTLEDSYLDGVSITYGSNPHNHIWSFGVAANLNDSSCECKTTGLNTPEFVGSNYFCDSATHPTIPNSKDREFFGEYRLWQGNCSKEQHSCCSFNSPPVFCWNLPETTTEDIEVRLCGNTALELLQIYVQ